MHISLVVAASENNIIGNHGNIPWDLPDDMRHFREITADGALVMGRKTHESIGRPLPRRRNIIVTRQAGYRAEGCETVGSVEEALDRLHAENVAEVFIIGGGEIYAAALPHATRIELTRIHATIEGDTVFPAFEVAEWHLVQSSDHPADDWHAHAFTFQTWERKPL